MSLGDGTDNREAEAGSVAVRRIGAAAGTGKTLKDLLPHLRWNSGAVVGDLEQNLAGTLVASRLDADAAAIRGVVDRVIEQIDDQSMQFVPVAVDHRHR